MTKNNSKSKNNSQPKAAAPTTDLSDQPSPETLAQLRTELDQLRTENARLHAASPGGVVERIHELESDMRKLAHWLITHHPATSVNLRLIGCHHPA